MAAGLNIIGEVAIDSDVPTHTNSQIIVRKNEVTVSRGATVLARKAGVVAVESTGARAWMIRFEDGTAWAAKMPAKRGGCGCR